MYNIILYHGDSQDIFDVYPFPCVINAIVWIMNTKKSFWYNYFIPNCGYYNNSSFHFYMFE